MTKEPEFTDFKQVMQQVQRFAETWAEAITEKFKPLSEAVAKMQVRGSFDKDDHLT